MNIDTRPEPCLAPSFTEDDEDSPILDGHEALVRKLREDRENREALAFLLRYETMIRQQEAEDMASLDYLRPCIERLEELAGITMKGKLSSKNEPLSWSVAESTLLTREISFSALKKVVDILEEKTPLTEHMLADRQLMMVLKVLTRKTVSPDDPAYDENDEAFITWAEIFQAYKTCIAGMFTLQHLPHDHFVRSRTRDRTMTLLSLFEGPTCNVFGQGSPTVDSSPLTHETKRPGAFHHTSPSNNNTLFMLVMMILMLVVGGITGFFFGGAAHQLQQVELPFSSHWRTPNHTSTETSLEPSAPIRVLPVSSPTITRLEVPIALRAKKTTVTSITVPSNKISDFSPLSQVINTRNIKTSTVVGSTLGVALAPVMLSSLNMLAAGVTIPTLVTAAVFTAGLATITAHASRGLFYLIRSLVRRNPGVKNKNQS